MYCEANDVQISVATTPHFFDTADAQQRHPGRSISVAVTAASSAAQAIFSSFTGGVAAVSPRSTTFLSAAPMNALNNGWP